MEGKREWERKSRKEKRGNEGGEKSSPVQNVIFQSENNFIGPCYQLTSSANSHLFSDSGYLIFYRIALCSQRGAPAKQCC